MKPNHTMTDKIVDKTLSNEVAYTVWQVIPSLTNNANALRNTLANHNQELDNKNAIAVLNTVIASLRETAWKLESTRTRIETYDAVSKEDYGQWLCQIVNQDRNGWYELGDAKSLKTCSSEQLQDIDIASVYVARYNPDFLEEIKELRPSTLGSLVVRYIKDNRKAVYEEYHQASHLTLDHGEIIKKLRMMCNTMEREVERSKAKKQKMNQ